MWTIAPYRQTGLFSLRSSLATASGAQSLLVPTPFAIKMALMAALIEQGGLEHAVARWPSVRDLEIALLPAPALVVNKTFIKIQRPYESKASGAEKELALARAQREGRFPFQPTIAFREFVQFDGELWLAARQPGTADLELAALLMSINYLGKRGSFLQLQDLPQQVEELDARWVPLTRPTASFSAEGTVQMLDDCGPGLTWEHINIYSAKGIKLNADQRVLRPIVLPYRLVRSSYRYSFYQRIEQVSL
ncbi:MAG: hypothetical protein KatS3mg057_1499 [Herpetosiphonaceae bacterium]|nr:MAG: hypothetical protein KatS3mg057_1499 [Herpetosiphonaceae bacterium]